MPPQDVRSKFSNLIDALDILLLDFSLQEADEISSVWTMDNGYGTPGLTHVVGVGPIDVLDKVEQAFQVVILPFTIFLRAIRINQEN